MPRISVIIPTFNRAALLKQALDSVLAQTHDNWEAIVIDDGSTDDTDAVLREYGAHITARRVDHAGAGVARNVGLQIATGDLITFLDSDDLLSPIALASQVAYLASHPEVTIAYCGWQRLNDDGTRVLDEVIPDNPPDMARVLVTHGVHYPPPFITGATVLPRKLVDDGMRFDQSVVGGEDVLFWMKLAIDGHTFGGNPQPLYMWRELHGSLGRDLSAVERNSWLMLSKIEALTKHSPRLRALLPTTIANAKLGIANQLLRVSFKTQDLVMRERALAFAAEALTADPSVVQRRPEFLERVIHEGAVLTRANRNALLNDTSRIFPARDRRQIRRSLKSAEHIAASASAWQRGERSKTAAHALCAFACGRPIVPRRDTAGRLLKRALFERSGRAS